MDDSTLRRGDLAACGRKFHERALGRLRAGRSLQQTASRPITTLEARSPRVEPVARTQ